MKNDVTVIIPAKLKTSTEIEWLVKAVKSVRIQVQEVIIGNDHSLMDWKDVEAEFVKAHIPKTVKVLVVPDGHKGVAAGRNTALSGVTTKYVIPLDADDYLAPGAVKKLLAAFPGNGYVYGAFVMFRGDKFGQPFYKEHTPDLLMTYQHFIPSGVLHLAEDVRKVGGWAEDVTAFEDWDFYLKCLENEICATGIPDTVVFYRQHDNSVMASMVRLPEMKKQADDVIKSRHVALYSGEVNMGSCCGHKITPRITVVKAVKASSIVPKNTAAPSKGMVLMQFIGKGSSVRSWFGLITGTRYRFGGKLTVAYVWDSDVSHLLSIRENGQPVFKKAEA